ncbi:MAG: hypothetical protein K8T10_05830 [Candidatus Eremiobacteraeota bacterium]|nr:hypothetical protein [Candidatus Eremiobacteraeota bacterium]
MEKSPIEKINLEMTLGRLANQIKEIGRYIFGESVTLFPIQYKETPETILTPAMILPGEWTVWDEKDLPTHISPHSIIWLRRRFNIPGNLENQRLCLYIWAGNHEPTGYLETVEGMVYLDGIAYQGIDWNHREVLLPEDFSSDLDHELTVRLNFKTSHKHRKIVNLEIREIKLPVFRLYQKLKTLYDSIVLLDKDRLDTLRLIEWLDDIIREVPFTNPGSYEFISAVEEVARKFEMPAELSIGIQPIASAIGHSHIDVAWLWDLSTTGRKTRQTFSTVCRLMEEYPDFTFIQSQPLLYEFVRESEPELFERIQNYSSEGRWQAEGATWVEPDMNIPSGESIVRQFLYGKKYFRKYFKHDCRILWLPDTFGFNGNLPQIMKKSGVDYFVTSKISWNQYTRFPYDVFKWRGIDGTEISSYFLTAPHRDGGQMATYNGKLIPSEIKGAWDIFSEKNILDEILLAYGFGDGGGGPTREMLERFPVLGKIPGIPKVKHGNLCNFFRKIEGVGEKLPIWSGELYLEYHRGTLTSRASIKKWMRNLENSLNILEKAVSLGILCGKIKMDEEIKLFIDENWKILLLNQFHDIIAGSSIHEVNVEAERQLKEASIRVNKKTSQFMQRLFDFDKNKYTIFNPNTFDAVDVVEIDSSKIEAGKEHLFEYVKSTGGKMYRAQMADESKIIFTPFIKALEAENFEFHKAKEKIEYNFVRVNGDLISTPFYEAKINLAGEITSFEDKRISSRRDAIIPGEVFNKWKYFEDRPLNWDAWDIDEYYREFPLEDSDLISGEWIENGPIRALFRTKRRFRNSHIIQDICFYAHTPRIDFKTRVEWHDKNTLIKASFPVNVNSNEAYYEIPFGYIARSTHKNYPQDRASFEVPAQRWAAVFENGYGGAVLNDCKYGYSANGSTLELTLLKSAVYPDPDAEEGIHQFIYSYMPVVASHPNFDLLKESGMLNMPFLNLSGKYQKDDNQETEKGGENSISGAFRIISRENHVAINTIKPAEDVDGIIIRLYESLNSRGEATLFIPECVEKAFEVNLLEEINENSIPLELTRKDRFKTIRLFFSPFEIKTIVIL